MSKEANVKSDETFSAVFLDRIDKLLKACKDAGTNITVITAEAGMGRATPDRWRKRVPKSIHAVDKLEETLAAYIKRNADQK